MKPTKLTTLIASICVLTICILLLDSTKTQIKTEEYDTKAAAAQKALECMEAIRQLKQDRGIPFSSSDINTTGMIGPDYSSITSTLGNLEAKRTSTNPNMAAIIVDMFHEIGLKEGDKIAVNFSGSFPALNIAAVCAIEAMELDPIIMSSFGASTHGANDPELTYLDMEHYLFEKGLFHHKSDYVSIGGYLDVGGDMPPDVVREIRQRLEGYGYPFFYEDDLSDNIKERYRRYLQYGEIRCFVNVGGNDVSFGDSKVIVYSDGGILTDLPNKDNSEGLVQFFLKDGIPVVHMLNIRSLASEYGLPIDPSPLPPVGFGGVYYRYEYKKYVAWIGLIGVAAILLKGRASKKGEGKKTGPQR